MLSDSMASLFFVACILPSASCRSTPCLDEQGYRSHLYAAVHRSFRFVLSFLKRTPPQSVRCCCLFVACFLFAPISRHFCSFFSSCDKQQCRRTNFPMVSAGRMALFRNPVLLLSAFIGQPLRAMIDQSAFFDASRAGSLLLGFSHCFAGLGFSSQNCLRTQAFFSCFLRAAQMARCCATSVRSPYPGLSPLALANVVASILRVVGACDSYRTTRIPGEICLSACMIRDRFVSLLGLRVSVLLCFECLYPFRWTGPSLPSFIWSRYIEFEN